MIFEFVYSFWSFKITHLIEIMPSRELSLAQINQSSCSWIYRTAKFIPEWIFGQVLALKHLEENNEKYGRAISR